MTIIIVCKLLVYSKLRKPQFLFILFIRNRLFTQLCPKQFRPTGTDITECDTARKRKNCIKDILLLMQEIDVRNLAQIVS